MFAQARTTTIPRPPVNVKEYAWKEEIEGGEAARSAEIPALLADAVLDLSFAFRRLGIIQVFTKGTIILRSLIETSQIDAGATPRAFCHAKILFLAVAGQFRTPSLLPPIRAQPVHFLLEHRRSAAIHCDCLAGQFFSAAVSNRQSIMLSEHLVD
ncbi:MAG TPA: hypothetical protein VKE98_06010 [Gemmataceae bacterium]|nr:hypothetical protein [Gemmataceae bacterium]